MSHSHIAVIVGIAGDERFLAKGMVVVDQKQARRFRSEAAAAEAARHHIAAFPPVIQRAMKFTVQQVEQR